MPFEYRRPWLYAFSGSVTQLNCRDPFSNRSNSGLEASKLFHAKVSLLKNARDDDSLDNFFT
jgi:hypothetical protein